MASLQARYTPIAYKQAAVATSIARKALGIVAKASKGSSGKAATKQVSYGKVRCNCTFVCMHGG